jgi:hypothetical protein
MKLSKSNLSTIIGIILVVFGVLIGEYLPISFSGISLGSIVMGIFFLFLQSVIELNIKHLYMMLKYLWKNILITLSFIIVEIVLGSSIRTAIPNQIENIIAQYSLFGVWIISGFYRTIIEVTPVILKMDLEKSTKFYITFSRTRLLYYFLLIIFFIRAGLLYGNNILNLLLFLFIYGIPTILFSFYIPVLPTEINWIITSWTNRQKLKLNINILQYMYKHKMASFDELKIGTGEDKKLRRALNYMIQQRFLKFSNNKYEFHPWFIIKQNIKFFI